MADLSHFDSSGNARMVDVGDKPETTRMALAKCDVAMEPVTLGKIKDGQVGKGDVLGIARLAGIMAAKKTSDLIPLCHPIGLNSVDIRFEFVDPNKLAIEAKVTNSDRTGVEMEAMTAVSICALTVYDMCKSIDRDMKIQNVRLVKKTGGKSGTYDRTDERVQ